MLLQRAADHHLLACKARNLSQSTITNYTTAHTIFIRYLADTLGRPPTVDDWTTASARGFQAFLREERTTLRFGGQVVRVGPATVATYVKILRVWANLLEREMPREFPEGNPMALIQAPKVPSKLPTVLTAEQVHALITACQATEWPERNVAILRLMLDTGVRVSELCSVTLDTLEMGKRGRPETIGLAGTLRVLGKGAREREVAFGHDAAQALREYLDGRVPLNRQVREVFLSSYGAPLSPVAIRRLLKVLARAAGLPPALIHPHVTRHTMATMLAADGLNALTLQQLLGHSSLGMTQKYVTLAARDIRASYVSPMDRRRTVEKKRRAS
jgi:integrase/recombinase XerC